MCTYLSRSHSHLCEKLQFNKEKSIKWVSKCIELSSKNYYHTDMVLQVTLSNWTKTVQVSHSVCVFREKTSHTLSLSQKNTKLKPCKLVMVPCIFLVYKQFAFSILSSHQFRIMFSLVLLIWLWSTLLHKNWTHSPLHRSSTYKVILFIHITIKTVSRGHHAKQLSINTHSLVRVQLIQVLL